jgi:DNA-directed RNA polymerase specialized sigma24 family protein
MSTHDEGPELGRTAAEAFARANWRRILPQLLRGAGHYLRLLGLAEGRRTKPWIEAPELVSQAFVDVRTGDRTWKAQAGESESSLVAYVSKITQSLAINECVSHAIAHRTGVEAAEHLLDEDPTPSRRCAEAEIRKRLQEIYADDDEAKCVLRACRAGYRTFDGIAEAMGCDVKHLETVWKRMKRRAEEYHATLVQDGEPGPTSPEPQGKDHADQEAAGRRDRAAHEPLGGPRVPRGGTER